MRHGSKHGDVAALLQREGGIMVLQQDDRLLVQGSRELDCLRGVDQLRPLRLRSSRIRVFEEAHFKFGPEHSRHGGVDDINVQLT